MDRRTETSYGVALGLLHFVHDRGVPLLYALIDLDSDKSSSGDWSYASPNSSTRAKKLNCHVRAERRNSESSMSSVLPYLPRALDVQ